VALQFVNIDEPSLALGIDARSAENQIEPGFLADLLNADVVGKRVRKRPGTQGYAGDLPVRATAVEYSDTDNQVILTLDTSGGSAIDVAALRSTPVVIYGRLGNRETGGPFTPDADTAKYYSGFTIPTRRFFAATGTSETLPITAAEHGMPSTRMYVGVVELTGTTDLSHTDAIPHDVEIDGSTRDLTLTYTNGTGLTRSVGVYTLDQTSEAGKNYRATISHTGSGAETFSISAGTHGLSNLTEMLVHVYQDVAGDLLRVRPDTVVVTTTGTVQITLTTGSATTYYAILSAVPVRQQVTGNIAGGTTSTITIPDITSPWAFTGVYLQLTPGGNYELVNPDTTTYDEATQTLTLSLTNYSSAAKNFTVYWEYGVLRSNRIAVTDASVTADMVDTSPQVTIWGLSHSGIYGITHTARAGWVTHLDSYRAPGEQRLLAGLGGNLYTARTYDESGGDYLYAELYPALRARTSADTTLAPLFWDTGETPGRTRGYITGDTAGTHWAPLTSVEYVPSSGYTTYTITLPDVDLHNSSGTGGQGIDDLPGVISTTTGLEDWLTVEGGSYAVHNGTFRIRARTLDYQTGLITVTVENEGITSSDWDDTDLGGRAGIFTDQLGFSSPGIYTI
jgi:hypothetical protein